MRITKFNIAAGRIGGLKALNADKLGKIVVLAGRNGSGKSRLIQYLSKWKSEKLDPSLPDIMSSPEDIIRYLRDLVKPANNEQKKSWNSICEDIASINRYLNAWEINISPQELQSHILELRFEALHEPIIVHFVPKHITLSDPFHQTKADLVQQSMNIDLNLGASELENNTLSRIQHFQNRYNEATHQFCELGEEITNKAKRDYETLQDIVYKFLGERLKRDADGNATLFGLRIGEGKFSDGQSILLQFCVAIHAQAHRLSELIVMMDEPENHLHPAAMLDAINEIQKHLTNGQLWIATHSLPLLANFDPDCIWWMADGEISHAGSNPEKVLHGLLGDEERIERLESFLGLPASLAINNFTAQCLQPPSVVTTGSEDPQLRQIHQALLQLHTSQRPLRILDVGSGRGRLISALQAEFPTTEKDLDYLAFDPSSEYEQECKDAIARCYIDSKERWFGSDTHLKAKHSEKSIDVVVMCNVLHEINPAEWLTTLFGPHGIAGHFLASNGYLMIVEDTEMRIGEKAHEKGFLVLNVGNLRTLFAITEADTGFIFNSQREGRLLATLIPANCLPRANHETLQKTLQQVCHEAKTEVQRIRTAGDSNTYRSGRKLAFYLQQFANASLAQTA